ncbi:hypothetical protein [Mastigocoleus testarum]|nr:hypothetical protein [Mastigocoleus testarum]KST69694.1 hypothetical protein BC008_05160 [Mastigocoleus testarum BC008]
MNETDSKLQSQNSLLSVPNSSLPQSPTNNLDISAATYLGGSEDDFTDAVDISLDSNVVIVGGSLKNAKLEGKETELLGGGDGTIVRYDSQTNQALATTLLPGRVIDLEVSNNGDIAVAYEGGIAVLNADATEVKWSKSFTDVSRIAISDSGKVGVVRDIKGGDRAYLFDSNGEQLQEWSTSGRRHFKDIAVSDQNGGMVVTTGFEQKTSILQVAFTQALSYEGENLWKNYDFDDEDIYKENLLADTRGQRVAFGRDGQLYASYYVNGGTGFSIFYRDPFDVTEELTDKRKIETDQYNSPTNVNSIQMLWYGRYDLKNGDLIKGQSLLGRRDDGKGNSVNADSITATKDGTVIIAGGAAGKIANRDEQTIEGQPVSEYTPYDGHLAIISPDLTERLSWTPISDSNGGVVAAVRDGKIAAVTTTDFEGSQITDNAIQENKGGKKDGYLLVIGGNDAPVGTTPKTSQPNLPSVPETEIETPTVAETKNENGREEVPTLDKQKADISLIRLTKENGDPSKVKEEEVKISQPILEIKPEAENTVGNNNPSSVDKQEIDSSEAVFETQTEIENKVENNNSSPLEKQEVNLSQPVSETQTEIDNKIKNDNSAEIDKKEDNLSQPILEIEDGVESKTGTNNPSPVDKQEDNLSQPVLETNTGIDKIESNNSLAVDKQKDKISQPILEAENRSDFPSSIFPKGLTNLSQTDSSTDKKLDLDRKFPMEFSDTRPTNFYNYSIGYYTSGNITSLIEDTLIYGQINPEKSNNKSAFYYQSRYSDLISDSGIVEESFDTNNSESTNFSFSEFSFIGTNSDSKDNIIGQEFDFEDIFDSVSSSLNRFTTNFNLKSIF